ncbi:MAG TPA: hypothetical protein VKB93_00940 [Thermoanaerobaculia bacterium]|nr:hypothetical protein [Thermoanaerobaculia bacterium]
MNRAVATPIIFLLLARSLSAGVIRVDDMRTYDTGTRLLNGRWVIGSRTEMTWFNSAGDRDYANWQTWHWINDIATGAVIATTGLVERNVIAWASTIRGNADFSSCYQGKAVGKVGGIGGDSKEPGGNHVCTESRPILPPPCEYRPEGCGVQPADCPLIVNTGNGPWRLSGTDDPVLFDIDADGQRDRLAWTARGSSLSFIALDRNQNGTIDDASELFGDHTPLANGTLAANGFDALRAFDLNTDDQVDENDAIWGALLLWTDANHDGISQPAELAPIANSGIQAFGTLYHWTHREDRQGNEFRFESKLQKERGQEPYYDVFFMRAR